MDVKIITLSYLGELFDGKIDYSSQVLDEESRALKARVILSNPELLLKPGMLADVAALKVGAELQLTIPTRSMVWNTSEDLEVIDKNDCEVANRQEDLKSSIKGITFISEGI